MADDDLGPLDTLIYGYRTILLGATQLLQRGKLIFDPATFSVEDDPISKGTKVSVIGGATGPAGPAGADGADGADGAPGPQGPSGVPGTVDTFANRPASSSGDAGHLFIPTDAGTLWVDDGSAWRPIIASHGAHRLGKEVPATGGFTHVQASGLTNGATFAKSNGVWEYTWTGSGSAGAAGSQSERLCYKAAPAAGATGYRVTAHFRLLGPALMGGTFSFLIALGWRLASNGSVEFMEWCTSNSAKANPQRRRYTVSSTGASPTFTFSAQVVSTADEVATKDIWLRIVRLNTGVRKFYISYDGIHWRKMKDHDTAPDEFFAPDQIIFSIAVFGDSNTDSETISGAVIDSWEEEAF